jgi:undecaprenyl diphosphate synthase
MMPRSALAGELAGTIDPANGGHSAAPRHVAIIMDGNGRWANRRGLPRFEGHRRGVEAVRRCVRSAIDLGVEYLTLYSFSSENWSRPASEVMELMGLLRRFIRNDLAELHKQNVRVKIIGEKTGLSNDIIELLADAESLTRSNTRLTLIIAFNYGARQEIIAVARKLAVQAVSSGLDPAQIDAAMIDKALTTSGIPDPDLLIRTSGEQRLSNFLLWQLAYAEFVFLPVLWPDFDKAALLEAIAQYHGRDRRFGGVGSSA